MDEVAACVVIYHVKHGPFGLLESNTSLSTIVNQNLLISLESSNPASYYIPEIELPANTNVGLFLCACYQVGHNKAWVTSPPRALIMC